MQNGASTRSISTQAVYNYWRVSVWRVVDRRSKGGIMGCILCSCQIPKYGCLTAGMESHAKAHYMMQIPFCASTTRLLESCPTIILYLRYRQLLVPLVGRDALEYQFQNLNSAIQEPNL